MKLLLAALAALAFVTAACSAEPDTTADGEWVLDGFVDQGRNVALPERSIELRIEGSEFGGDAGCNSMGGSASFSANGDFAVQEAFWTEMACEPRSVMDFEAAYTNGLLRATEWEVTDWLDDGQRLRLSSDTVELHYVPSTAVPDLPITGTAWVLDTFFDGDTAMNAAGMDAVTVTFTGDSVRAAGECWSIAGPATIEPGGTGNLRTDFTTADPDFTCDDRAFFAEMVERLSSVREYEIVEHRLTLGQGGEPVVGFGGRTG